MWNEACSIPVVHRVTSPLLLGLVLAVAGTLVAACTAQGEDGVGESSSAVTTDAGADADAGPLPPFHGVASMLDKARRDTMSGISQKTGCPITFEHLRLLTLDHWGFDGQVHEGHLVVHEDQSNALLTVFEAVFRARYPIARMQLVDVYGGDDDLSMDDDNTSAFNCRPKTGQSNGFSEHSYGRAIDINPVQNPYVTSGGTVSPPAGAPYAKRTSKAAREPGVIHANDAVVKAFANIGWKWGGDWSGTRDYQHFSLSGK